MIQANELRLGNKIEFSAIGSIVDVIGIALTNNNVLFIQSKLNKSLFFEQPVKYKPIQLTEEILLKNKWGKVKHSFCKTCFVHDDFYFDIVKHGDLWVLARYTNEECTECFYFAHGLFQYVHLFQNLYFTLTGEELEINL